MTLDDVYGADLDRFPLEQEAEAEASVEAEDWDEEALGLDWDEAEEQEISREITSRRH
ncbi:MAG TPA: hypothetical protein VF280_16035 [Burkholderiales bacterium]|jgi:hypothetical protein